MKKTLILLTLLAGCKPAASKQGVIAVIPKGQVHLFWQTVKAGAEKAGKDEGVEVAWMAPQNETDYTHQMNIVEDAVNRKVAAIVLAPSHQKSLVPAAEKAVAAGIPLVVIDSELDYDKSTSFVATDNTKAGALSARRMGEVLRGKGKVAIVGIAAGTGSGMAREAGFQETMKKAFPEIVLVPLQYCDSDKSKAVTVSEDFLTRHPDLAGIFGSAEPCLAGALRAVETRNLKGKVKLVGIDASPALLEALKEGTIDGLIVQDPFRIGYEGVRAAASAIRGKPPEKRIDTGTVVITRENLDSAEVKKVLNPPGASDGK